MLLANEMQPCTEGTVRVDKWLWAARFFKTRAMASKACDAGHVTVDGASAKSSKAIRVGNRIEAQTPGGLRIVVVTLLHDKRVAATLAQTFYEDHTPPPPPRDDTPRVGSRERGAGRPTKRERRELDRLRRD